MAEDYYGVENIHSALAKNEALYYRSLQYILGDPPVLGDPNKPINAVLGGFNPRSGIDEKYKDFVDLIHPHPENREILLDLNKTPFNMLSRPEIHDYKLIADLAEMPVKENSVDLVIMDYTSNFMKDEDIEKLGQELERTMTREGVLLLVQDVPLVGVFNRFIKSRMNREKVYARSESKISRLLEPLKSIFMAEMKGKEIIMGFARSDSGYPTFEREPIQFSYEHMFDSEWMMKDRKRK